MKKAKPKKPKSYYTTTRNQDYYYETDNRNWFYCNKCGKHGHISKAYYICHDCFGKLKGEK